MTLTDKDKLESIVLGGGCFWCLEAIFTEVKGVINVQSGYSGGNIANPTYDQVSKGKTNHAEVIQITFKSEIISLERLLEIFFSSHDPTTLNKQGPDVGTQYRSIILYSKEEHAEMADEVMLKFERTILNKKIVTEIQPLDTFYPAEKYHQNYFKKNPFLGYCQLVISPKVLKFRKQFSAYLK